MVWQFFCKLIFLCRFCYDGKHRVKELKKKVGKDLDTKKIFKEFAKEESKEVDIVASYLSKVVDGMDCHLFLQIFAESTGEEQTSVEFFNEEDLDSFLFKRTRREHGILQKFILPKGSHNCMVVLDF